MEYRLYIGVDVSKESFTVCIKNPNGKTVFQGSFPQSLEGFQDFLNTVNNLSTEPVIVGMESTSIYYLNLFSFLLENGINTVIINPSVIKNFSKLGIRDAKSDRKDASTIAEYLLYAKPELSDKEKLSDLKLLSREKEKLSKEISHLKDEILRCLFNLFPELERNFNVFSKGMLNFLLKFPSARKIRRSKRKTVEYEFNKAFEGRGKKPSFTANDIIELANRSIGIDSVALEEILVTKINMLLTIEEEIDKFDKLISERIEEIQIDKIDIITSIPGIGKSLATSFICEVPEVEMFKDGKSLVAFVGVDPVVRQSGQYIGKHGISKKGNRHLRRIIYLMAINVIRFEGRFKEFYLRLRARGKSYMEAVIAVANKLLRTIYAMLIHRTYYSPNYS
jgi:transposase